MQAVSGRFAARDPRLGGSADGRGATSVGKNARRICPFARKEDSSSRVQRELISVLHRLDKAPRLELAAALLDRITDKQPRNWQRLAWYALEPHVASQPLEMVELDRTLQSSLLSQAIARGLARKMDGRRKSSGPCGRV